MEVQNKMILKRFMSQEKTDSNKGGPDSNLNDEEE